MLLTVRSLRALSADFRLLELAWPAGEPDPLPGQFVMVRTREGSARSGGVRSACTTSAGGAAVPSSRCSSRWSARRRAISALAKGDAVDVLGPHGRGFPLDAREHWLVAGGRGLAPLFYLARLGRRAGLACRVLVGGRKIM